MSDLIELPDDLTAQLLPEYDNEETLEFLEHGASSHSLEAFKNDTEAAKFVFLILYHKVWRHRRNPDGTFKYFRDGKFLQELYIPDLTRIVRWHRASIFDKFRALKFAVNGLGLLPEQIDEYGGIKVFEVIEKDVSSNGKIDHKGRLIEFKKDTNGLEPKEYILNVIKSYSPENTDEMVPGDIRGAFRTHLTDQANIWFEPVRIKIGPGDSGYETRWCREKVEDGILDHQNGLMSEPNIPADVLAEYCKRLRMKNPTNVVQEAASASPGAV